MRTVKEISDLTGISVRTLHYYDEIGLLKPTEKSDAGYRLYDDKALETLQQILFFREFDISLKEIKAVLDNPALDRNQILQVQRKMLVTKKERMERLIASIDDILKGENKMDFTIFTKTEVEEMFQTMLEHMPENMRNIAIKEFGSIEQWKKHYMEVVSSEEMQKGYAKVVEWYGGKDKFLSVARTPVSKEVAESYNKRIEAILQKLIAKQNCDIDSFEVKELVGEYGFVMKQLAQIKEEKGFMMAQAQYYRNEQIKPMIDEKYGEGASDFFAQAIENYYTSSERNRTNGIFKGRGRRRIPGAIAPDRLNGKGLPPHRPDACGLRTRIPDRTALRAMMARSPKAASFKRTAGKAVPLTA